MSAETRFVTQFTKKTVGVLLRESIQVNLLRVLLPHHERVCHVTTFFVKRDTFCHATFCTTRDHSPCHSQTQHFVKRSLSFVVFLLCFCNCHVLSIFVGSLYFSARPPHTHSRQMVYHFGCSLGTQSSLTEPSECTYTKM